ncbi:hypothetical protein DXG01_009417 [Tephrocybe rancida]|nr:hypothetical protein DXG01_009417 [Tephrocybe rancida]
MNEPLRNPEGAKPNRHGHVKKVSKKDKLLIARLTSIFQDKQLCKDLVGCQGPDAQTLLDSFQRLLDRTDLDLSFRKDLTIATQRASSKSNLYPSCYKLKYVDQIGEYPVVSGGFADIYKGQFHGQVKFWKEAMLWGQLSHPNALTIYGLFFYKNRVSIVAPWMENGNINSYLKDKPDVPRAWLANDTASGLSYLHDNDIIHGDLKGANILVDESGRARLADFGISSVMDADIVSWTTQTSSSSEGGTVRWQAPELYDVVNDVLVKNNKESDVYALGCFHYEHGKIFTGKVPFHNIAHDMTVTLKVRSGVHPTRPEAASPSWSTFGLTEKIWTCTEQCWSVNPSGRPSAQEIVRSLTANLAKDTRPNPVVSRLSPREFRRQMSGSFKMITVKDLNHILEKSTSRRLGASGTELNSDRMAPNET